MEELIILFKILTGIQTALGGISFVVLSVRNITNKGPHAMVGVTASLAVLCLGIIEIYLVSHFESRI